MKMLNSMIIEKELEKELLHHRLTEKEVSKIVSSVLEKDIELLDEDLRNPQSVNDFKFDIAMTFNKEFDLFGCIYYLKTNDKDLLYITEVSGFEFQ